MIGTHTLRHMQGYNNFVQRDLPLGWYNGSDGEQFRFGFKMLSKKFLLNSNIGTYRYGAQNIRSNPYSPYLSFIITDFPSGEIKKMKFANFELEWWWRYNLSIGTGVEWSSNNEINGNHFFLYLNYFLPTKFILNI